MKLAFSTLGCPGWSFSEICTTAKDIGMDGIEIRGLGSEIYAPKISYFQPDNIQKTIDSIAKMGLEISMFTSSVTLADCKSAALQIAEATDYINLAHRAGVKYIRVMGENTPDSARDFDLGAAAKTYAEICDLAAEKNVLPLIETNGALADSEKMLEFLEKTNRDNAFVLWDVHHPYRYMGEPAEKTVSLLGDKIKYVHVKDSVMADKTVIYKNMGSGDIPVAEAISALSGIGYDGYITLEWVKRWNPDLQEPGIVFYNFASYIKRLVK